MVLYGDGRFLRLAVIGKGGLGKSHIRLDLSGNDLEGFPDCPGEITLAGNNNSSGPCVDVVFVHWVFHN